MTVMQPLGLWAVFLHCYAFYVYQSMHRINIKIQEEQICTRKK